MVKTNSVIRRKTSKLVTKKQLRLMTVKEIQDLRIQGKLLHFNVKYVNDLILAKLRNHKRSLGPFLLELRHYCCDKRNEKNIEKIFAIFATVAADMDQEIARLTGSSLSSHIVDIQEMWIKKRLNSILIKTEPVKQEDVMIVYSHVG